jgi:hypothetical protein
MLNQDGSGGGGRSGGGGWPQGLFVCLKNKLKYKIYAQVHIGIRLADKSIMVSKLQISLY